MSGKYPPALPEDSGGEVLCSDSQVCTFEVTLKLAALVLLCHIGTLVIQLFAAAETDLNLDEAVLEIHAERNQRESLGLQGAAQLVQFGAVQEELPVPERIAVENIPLFIRIDMHAVNVALSVFDAAPGFFNGAVSCPDGFHLKPDGMCFVVNEVSSTK